MESNVAGAAGGSRRRLLADHRRTSHSLPVQIDSRVPKKLWRLRSPKSQAKYPSQAAQFEQESAGISTLVKALIGLVLYLVAGIVSFSLLQQQLQGTKTSTIVDAMYFAIVTMTTVGYGDLVPRGTVAKLFTCAFVFLGFGLVGALVSGAANYLVEKQETILVQKFHKHQRETDDVDIVDDDEVVAAKWKAAVSGAAVVVLFIAGVLVLMFCEGFGFVDAFYCVCVTVTTLGYGDESFTTEAGRLFAVFWILSSTVCVAQFFLYLAESRTEERQRQLAVWALSRPTTASDLDAADLDGDGAVSPAEFAIYKLKELGKINADDVLDVLKEFEALDHDQSGTLNWLDNRNSSQIRQSAHAA